MPGMPNRTPGSCRKSAKLTNRPSKTRAATVRERRPTRSKHLPLLPCPQLAVGVALRIDLEFKYACHRIQRRPLGVSRAVVNRPAIADRAGRQNLAHAAAFPRGHAAVRREHHPVSLAIQTAVRPRLRAVSPNLVGVDAQNFSGAFK